MRLAFVGGGNMATAMIGGLLKRGTPAGNIRVIEIEPQARARLQSAFGVGVSEQLPDLLVEETIVLAVKPQQLAQVARALVPRLANQLILSIAAGVRSADLARWLNGYDRIVRAMPNTPALVGAGVSGLYATATVSQPERERAQELLGAVGATLWFTREEDLDVVTAVSGSGPAYVFYFIEAIEQAARAGGLSEQAARMLTQHTFAGAAALALQSQESPRTLRERVTSKGGTTERALAVLMQTGVGPAIEAAVAAAAQRSRELGDQLGAQG